MNKFFLTLIACMLMSANARFFRGADLLKTGKDFLKSIHLLGDSADFQGADHYDHTHRGDVEHKATESGMTTEAHITSEIAINLGAKMPGYIAQVREILETQVDTGVTFCGNPYERVSGTGAGKKLSEIVGTDAFSPNHAYTDSAVSYDGVVASQTQISETDDVHQCGNSNCVSGSVVASVAQFIRAQGYHINHADICRARGSVTDITSRTCNLVTSPSLVKSFNCKKKTGFSDQWKYDRECAAFGVNYRVENDGTANPGYGNVNGSSPCDATSGPAANCVENDDNCIYDPAKLAALDNSSLCEEDAENAIVPFPCSYLSAGAGLTDSVGGACTPVKNQLKRILKYGVISGGKADIDDSTIVTGAADGCTSLRGIVLAINGNKLERTYVSKQHDAAEDYWQGQIDDTRAIIKTIREKIINLQGLGNFFYPLENADKYECDSEFGPFEQGIDAGGAEDPKCDLAGTDYSSFQGTPHTKSMAIRASCFCRSFADSGDEFYLTTTESTGKAFCDSTFKEKLPSVYTYCLNHKQLGETDTWKAALDQLLFSPNDIPTNLDTWFHGASAEIKKNFEDSIAGQGTKCGRVSSADPAAVKFSNKGGNCIPLQGIQDIVYRLEFEYFNADAAVNRKGNGNTYADIMCVANPDGDQILSFRQLAYVWQRMGAVTANQLPAETDTNGDNIQVNNPKSQFYDDDGQDNYQDFCSVDYAQMLGGGKAYVDAGMAVADPLDFLARVNSEASENVEATANAKNAALEAESRLWSKLSDELTLDADGRIIKKIGDRAAAHFKRINSHEMASDVIGNIPLCKEKVIAAGTKAEARGFYSCEDIKEFSTAAGVGTTTPFVVEKWAFYGAVNLEKITLPGQVTVEEMAFRKIGNGKTVNFATNKYEGEGTNAITLDVHAVSHPTKCGVSCDADYKASKAATHALCELSSGGVQTDLNAAECNFDNDLFEQKHNNAKTDFDGKAYNDGDADRFLSKSIDRNTKLECTASSDGLKVIDVQLPANCGKLTIGDLTQCSKLTHIYIKRNAGCALTQLDTSGAKIGAAAQFIWSDDAGVVDQIKAEADFSAASAHKLSFGVANTIEHVGGAKVTDGEVCSKETQDPAGDATAAAAAVKQLLKLPFGQGLSGTGQNAQAVFKCLNATGSAENCDAQDVADAQGLHRGFLCEIDGMDAQKINCDGGKLEFKSDYVPTKALEDLWNNSNSASCTNADAEQGALKKCAFGGIQSIGALPGAGSKSDVEYRCVEANANNNGTIDRVCVAGDRQDAADSHYGLTCTTPASIDSTCTDAAGNTVTIARFGDAAACSALDVVNKFTDNVPVQDECKDANGNDVPICTGANFTDVGDNRAAVNLIAKYGADATNTWGKNQGDSLVTATTNDVFTCPLHLDVGVITAPVAEDCTLGAHSFDSTDTHHIGNCRMTGTTGGQWPTQSICMNTTTNAWDVNTVGHTNAQCNSTGLMFVAVGAVTTQSGQTLQQNMCLLASGELGLPTGGTFATDCPSHGGTYTAPVTAVPAKDLCLEPKNTSVTCATQADYQANLCNEHTIGDKEVYFKSAADALLLKFSLGAHLEWNEDSANPSEIFTPNAAGGTLKAKYDVGGYRNWIEDLYTSINYFGINVHGSTGNIGDVDGFAGCGANAAGYDADGCRRFTRAKVKYSNPKRYVYIRFEPEVTADPAAPECDVGGVLVNNGIQAVNAANCTGSPSAAAGNVFKLKGADSVATCKENNGNDVLNSTGSLVDPADALTPATTITAVTCAAAAKVANTHTQGTDNQARVVCENAASADHTVVHIDPTVAGHDLDVVSSQPWKPGALTVKAGGAQSYLLSDGVTLAGDQLSKVCPKASEVIVPNSVTKLGVGFVINLNTEAAGTLDVYIGDSVAVQAPAIAIDETANVLPNNVNNVAAFFRRCPADGTRKYEFDNLTPRDASGAIDRTAAKAATSTKLHTMNERSARNLENGIVDTCLN